MAIPTLPYAFKNEKLLAEALTHPSLIPLKKNPLFHYERLEFLGDAVLNTCLSHELFKLFPEAPEGTLAKAKNALAKGDLLAAIAKKLSLDEYIQLSPGEKKQNTHQKFSVLASVWEAIIAVAFLENGLEGAQKLILLGYQQIHPQGLAREWIEALILNENPKGHLQEYLQNKYPNAQILYEVLSITGPDHAKQYEISVKSSAKPDILGIGRGPSKKTAEENAAQQALTAFKK